MQTLDARYPDGFSEEDVTEAKQLLESWKDRTVDERVILDRYSTTSHKYDKAMITSDYNAPVRTATTAGDLFPENRDRVYILDIGAGTGLVGVELKKLGFDKMDALDGAAGMLEEAKKKEGVYGRFLCTMLGEEGIASDTDTYDAVVICGLSTDIMRRLPLDALEEIVRVVKPGGYIINTAFYTTFDEGNDDTKEFRERLVTLEARGVWEKVAINRFTGYFIGQDGAICIHRVRDKK